MGDGTVVIITLLAYKVLLLGLGILAERWNRDEADYFLGGRKLGPVVAAVSASASSSSAWTLLGVSGAAYGWGLGAVWLFPGCVGGFCLNWFVLAPALRLLSHRDRDLTVTQVLAGPVGGPGRGAIVVSASLIVIFSFTVYVASQFQGAGKSLNASLGLDPVTSVLLGAGVIVVYVMLGGFWAVSLTDTLQGLVMAAASVLLPIGALVAVGGPGPFIEGLQAVAEPGYLSLTRGMATPAAIGFVLGILGIGLGYPGQPHVVNRFMAMREGGRTMRTARFVAITWAVVVYSGMLILGWCGRVLHPAIDDPEAILVLVNHEVFPPVVAGVILAALLSAIMSTVDSQLLVAAAAVTHDLGLGGPDPRTNLLRSRLVVFGLSAVAVVLALEGPDEIFSTVLFAWTAMGAAFGPLLVVTVLRGRVAPRTTLVAMLAGFGLAVAAYNLPFARNTAWERVFPFAVALLIALLPAARRGPTVRESPLRPGC